MPGNTGRDMSPASRVHDTTWIAELTGRHERRHDQRVPVAQDGQIAMAFLDIVSEALARGTGCGKSARPGL
jgi:hypothetical protein